MYQGTASTTLAIELELVAAELDGLCQRVEREGTAVPVIDSSGWSGLASWACQLSLSALRRELDAAADLLRCAANLAAAAAFEVNANA